MKDSPENVALFVERNLRAGVDHMFIFLDAAQPGVEEVLAGQPHVTAVAAYGPYWGGRRPDSLNTRQAINANLIRVLLAPLGWAQWLFHIDGDECLDIDKDHLRSLDPTISSVKLEVLEGVSTADGRAGHLFKRQLDAPDLTLLHLLGVIDRPENRRLFNGHLFGKAGIRPSLDHQLHIHNAKDLEGERLDSYEDPRLRLLHFDSVSYADFRSKWASNLSTSAVHGPKKDQVRNAVTSVVRNEHLDEGQQDRYLRLLYARTMQDDVETLSELGFLDELDPARHSYTPERLTDEQVRQIQVLLPLLEGSGKGYYRVRMPEKHPATLLARLSADLEGSEPALAAALARCAAASGGAG